MALCLVDLLTSSSLSFRLYDFVFVFLSFYIIFERGYSLKSLFLISLFWFVALYLDALVTISAEISSLFHPNFMEISFSGSFANSTKTVFFVTSIFSLLAFFLMGPLSFLVVVPLGLTILISTSERGLLLGYLIQIFFCFLGSFEVKKNYKKLFLVILFFVFCIVISWIVFAPLPKFAVHPFFNTLCVRIVLYAKALFVIAEHFPRGLGENGCIPVLGSVDLTSYLPATFQNLRFVEGQKEMLLFHAAPILK